MEGNIAAELHRLIDDDTGALHHSSEDADATSDANSSQAEEADAADGESSAADSEDMDSEDDNDEFDDMDDANEANATDAQLDTAGLSDQEPALPSPPETDGQSQARDTEHSHKQSNARDLKATGVARAAARLLQQDTLEGGLGIFSKSKSVAKRQAEEAADSKADRAAKRLRLEMKHRGHTVVPKRGDDPQHDAAEKALLKLATRGVVRLFNAVSKAQRDQKDALVGGSRSKVAKLDKASFLAELRGVGAVKGGAPLPAGTGPATAGPAVVPAVQGQAQTSPAWDVLSEGFGLQGGAKMKDWDKEDDSDADIPNEALDNLSDSDDDE